ncbi:MAG: CBS domain-containing protein [Clostridia bacterium]|nr:CBS domain-containing protein [Clostridia bacterium]
MNILFFLTPKSEVEFAYNDDTVESVMDHLEKSTYTAIPIINHKGEYKGTVSEGDLLWFFRDESETPWDELYKCKISKIASKRIHKPVKADAKIKDLVNRAMKQNFVPVIDDDDVFIGIVKRRDILSYYFEKAESS